eukprot:759534-Hanusia_phi.AAC.1
MDLNQHVHHDLRTCVTGRPRPAHPADRIIRGLNRPSRDARQWQCLARADRVLRASEAQITDASRRPGRSHGSDTDCGPPPLSRGRRSLRPGPAAPGGPGLAD